jgi:uncharacterized protein (DUF2342 family)
VTATTWTAPAAVAKLITRPSAAPRDLPEAVAAMRETAAASLTEVVATTGMPAAPAPVLVTDRNGMVDGVGHVFSNILARSGLTDPSTASRHMTGLVAAPAMAFVNYHVLGMYDPWGPDPRLMLSAPNILQAAAAIGDDRRFVTDLVCLREQTHRVQHVAAPWIPYYLCQLARAAVHRCGDGCDDVKACARRRSNAHPNIIAAVSVIEGYAKMVSEDLMGARYEGFAATKQAMQAGGPISRWASHAVLRVVSPLRSMAAHYRAGEEFCRTIVNSADIDILNELWAGPEIMPTLQELTAPKLWWARV